MLPTTRATLYVNAYFTEHGTLFALQHDITVTDRRLARLVKEMQSHGTLLFRGGRGWPPRLESLFPPPLQPVRGGHRRRDVLMDVDIVGICKDKTNNRRKVST